MKKHVIYIFLLIPLVLCGQQNILIPTNAEKKIKSKIVMQKGVKKLLNKSLVANKMKSGLEGFCIQIYNGQSREEAQRMKYKFMRLFPEIESVSYKRVNPNWKVTVGRFRTKLEAQKLQNTIKKKYPNCFISKTYVEIGQFD